jgi:hypothetical protein
MKSGVIILAGVILLSVILLNGCAKTNSSVDMDNLIQSAENCTPDSASHEAITNVFGISITTNTFYQIQTVESPKCALFMRLDDIKFKFTEEFIKKMKKMNSSITDEQIQEAEDQANNSTFLVNGKNGTCTFTNNQDLVKLLKKIKSNTVSGGVNCSFSLHGGGFNNDTINSTSTCETTGDWAVAKCSGGLFSSDSVL